MATLGESSGLLFGAPLASTWPGASHRVHSPAKSRSAGQCAGTALSPTPQTARVQGPRELSPSLPPLPSPAFLSADPPASTQGGPSLALGTGCAVSCHVRQQTLGGPEGGREAADPARPRQSSAPIGVETRGPDAGSAVWRGLEKSCRLFSRCGAQTFA